MARFVDDAMKVVAACWACIALMLQPSHAAVIAAGPGTETPTLAAAVRLAKSGDTIRLAAGTYYECAVLSQAGLVLEGVGPETVVTDTTCEGKALLVVRGDGLTVRDLALKRARVPDHNGAGIRLEGQGLTVDRVRFENNEVGILAGQGGPGTLVVGDSAFIGGGIAGDRPTAAIMAGPLAVLRIERTTFEDVKGAQVSTAASRTEIVGSMLSSGVEAGAGFVVQASGGLQMDDSEIALGPNAPPRHAAVLATGDGAVLHKVRLRNDTGQPATLLLDWTGGRVDLAGSTVGSGDVLVSSAGEWRHRAGEIGRSLTGELRRVAGGAKRAMLGSIGR